MGREHCPLTVVAWPRWPLVSLLNSAIYARAFFFLFWCWTRNWEIIFVTGCAIVQWTCWWLLWQKLTKAFSCYTKCYIYLYTFRRIFFMAAVSEHLSEYRHIVCYYVVLIAMSDQISSYKTWPGQDLEPYCLWMFFDSAFLWNCSSLCGSWMSSIDVCLKDLLPYALSTFSGRVSLLDFLPASQHRHVDKDGKTDRGCYFGSTAQRQDWREKNERM